jgi:hypothetical protein
MRNPSNKTTIRNPMALEGISSFPMLDHELSVPRIFKRLFRFAVLEMDFPSGYAPRSTLGLLDHNG